MNGCTTNWLGWRRSYVKQNAADQQTYDVRQLISFHWRCLVFIIYSSCWNARLDFCSLCVRILHITPQLTVMWGFYIEMYKRIYYCHLMLLRSCHCKKQVHCVIFLKKQFNTLLPSVRWEHHWCTFYKTSLKSTLKAFTQTKCLFQHLQSGP